jgi:hypothetical protein
MPQNDVGWLLIIGAVFFLIGLLGGGVEVSAVKIPSISRYPRIVFLVVGAILLVLALYLILVPNPVSNIPAAAGTSANLPSTEIPTALPTDNVTATSTPDLTPTASPTPLATTNTIFSDDFETDAGVWVIGEQKSTGTITEKKTIIYGKYVWEATAAQSVFLTELPSAPVVSDFELQAELRLVSGAEDATYGLIFGSNEKGVFAFQIQRGGFMLAYLDRQKNVWDFPVNLTISPKIIQNGPNILRVVAKDSNIQLFIQDEFVGSTSDSRLSTGKTGITVSLYNEADSAKVEFDDFQLTGPQE